MDFIDAAREILQSWIADWLWPWVRGLVTLAGGTLLAWSKSRDWHLATPVLYGLGAAAAIYILLGGLGPLSGSGLRSDNPKVVETHVRNWLDTFRYGVKKQQDKTTHFKFEVRTLGGRPLTVFQPKDEYENLIFVQGKITVSPEHVAQIKKLSPAKQQQLTSELGLELLRIKIQHELKLSHDTITVHDFIPIIGLTDWGFIERISRPHECYPFEKFRQERRPSPAPEFHL